MHIIIVSVPLYPLYRTILCGSSTVVLGWASLAPIDRGLQVHVQYSTPYRKNETIMVAPAASDGSWSLSHAGLL